MPTPMVQPKFPLGKLVMTKGVAALVTSNADFAKFCIDSLYRHGRGDWGDLSADDKRENDYALQLRNLRILSLYERAGMPKIWIITEADRSVTTTLFPEEY